MPNYYDTVLAEMMFNRMYPHGNTERRKVDGEWQDVAVPPDFLPNTFEYGRQRAEAKGEASMMEDAMLREQLGGRYKKGKGDKRPPGTYSPAKYPGFEHQVWAQESGFLPKGFSWRSLLDESPQERMMREQEQRKWAAAQRGMVGWR